MRSPSAFEKRLLAAATMLAVLGLSHAALADEKAECSSAYDQAQTLRHEGKLQAARQQAASCTRDACAEFIRTDCAKWLGEIEQSQPTVVFEVHDAHGRETRAVQVALDGKPWLEKVDGGAKLIDPGQHTLHYVIEGQAPIDETVEIREGEKNRKLTASFEKASAGPGPIAPTKPSTSAPLESPASSRSPAPWIIGGVGLASLVVGAITGGLVLHDKSVVDKECAGKACSADGFAAAKNGRTLGPVTTVALVVGGVGVGVGTIWLIARPSVKHDAPPRAALSMGPTVGTTGATWRLEGSF